MAPQTPPPGAKIIDLVNVVKAPPAPSNIDDDLDSLLAELDASKPVTPAEDRQKPLAGSAEPAETGDAHLSIGDNLDSLLNDLAANAEISETAEPADAEPVDIEPVQLADTEPADTEPAQPETAGAGAEADMDNNDFEEFNPDDLESLLNDLSKNADPAPVPPAPPTVSTSPAVPEPARKNESLVKIELEQTNPPAFDASELDALLDELGAKNSGPPPLSGAGEAPLESTGLLDSEDLDSLLAEIAPAAMAAQSAPAPAQKTTPAPAAPSPPDKARTSAAPAPSPADSAGLEQFLSGDEIKVEPQQTPAKGGDSLDDDLDSPLVDLEGDLLSESELKHESPAAPPLTASDDDWDLDIPAPEPAAAPPVEAADSKKELPSPDTQALSVVINPALEAALAQLIPNLDQKTVREIYQTVLSEVLKQIIPKLVGQEVARQVNREIEAIKRLAGID